MDRILGLFPIISLKHLAALASTMYIQILHIVILNWQTQHGHFYRFWVAQTTKTYNNTLVPSRALTKGEWTIKRWTKRKHTHLKYKNKIIRKTLSTEHRTNKCLEFKIICFSSIHAFMELMFTLNDSDDSIVYRFIASYIIWNTHITWTIYSINIWISKLFIRHRKARVFPCGLN